MKVAKAYKKHCGKCDKAELVEYGEKEKYILLRCSVCKTEISRTDYDDMYERLLKLMLEPDE